MQPHTAEEIAREGAAEDLFANSCWLPPYSWLPHLHYERAEPEHHLPGLTSFGSEATCVVRPCWGSERLTSVAVGDLCQCQANQHPCGNASPT